MNEDPRAWAERLESARRTRTPIEPITRAEPCLAVEEAYEIAELGIARRLAGGAALVGHKIGLTSAIVQRQLGVDRPDYGALLADMRVGNGDEIPANELIAPRIELELAFVLASRLEGPGITVDDVTAATQHVVPAIEIVDSRIADWQIALGDTIADNASAAAFVVGDRGTPIDQVGVAALDATLYRNGRVVEAGNTRAVLEDPRIAVAWLADALSRFGTSLEAGQIVLSGACTRMVDAAPGDVFRGVFGPLGDVSVAFAGR